MTNNNSNDDPRSPERATSKGLGPTSQAGLVSVGAPTPTGKEASDEDDSGIDDLLAGDNAASPSKEELVVLSGSTMGAPNEPFPLRTTGEVTRVMNPNALAAKAAEGLALAAGDLGKILQTAPEAPVADSPSQPIVATLTDQPAASTDVDATGGAGAAEAKRRASDDLTKESCHEMMKNGFGGNPLDARLEEGVYLFDAHFLWLLLEQGEALEVETPHTDTSFLRTLSARRHEVLLELAQRENELTTARLESPDINEDDLMYVYTGIMGGVGDRTGERQKNGVATQELIRAELERRQAIQQRVVAAAASAPVDPIPANTGLGTAATVAAKDSDLTPGPERLAAASSTSATTVAAGVRSSRRPQGTPRTPHRAVTNAHTASVPLAASPPPTQSGVVVTPVPLPIAAPRHVTPQPPIVVVAAAVSAPAPPTVSEPPRRITEKFEIRKDQTGTVFIVIVVLVIAGIIGLLLRARHPNGTATPSPIVAQQPTSDAKPVVVPTTPTETEKADSPNALPQAVLPVDGNPECTLIPVNEIDQVSPGSSPEWLCQESPPILKINPDADGQGGTNYYQLCPSNCKRNTK